MSKIVELHVQNAIAWQHENKFGVTKEQRDSMFVLIDEYLRIKAENGALRDVLTKAAAIGLAHGIGVAEAVKPMRSNDRVEGRDAALSRRVPSHDGLEGNGTGHHE